MPTETALYILSRAEPLRAHIAEIERHVELMTQLDTGHLNLGVGPIIEQVMLPEVLKIFVETTGDVDLSIVTEDEETLLAMFRASELDIVVGPFLAAEQIRDHTMAIPMIKDTIIAVAGGPSVLSIQYSQSGRAYQLLLGGAQGPREPYNRLATTPSLAG